MMNRMMTLSTIFNKFVLNLPHPEWKCKVSHVKTEEFRCPRSFASGKGNALPYSNGETDGCVLR